MPGAVGDLGQIFGQDFGLGADQAENLAAQTVAGRGLAALAAMNQNPMMMQPGIPPGAGPMPTTPTAPPPMMGGAPGMGPPPPQAPQMPQGANAKLMGQGQVAYNPQPAAAPGSFASRFPQTGQGSLPGQAQAPPQAAPPPSQQPPQQQIPPMPMGGMPGMPGAFSLQQIVQAVQQANPGAPPNVLFKAVAGMVPLMRPADQEYWKMIAANQGAQRLAQGEQRIQQTGELGQQKLQQGEQRIQQKQQQFDANQERMKAATAIRQDQTWQRLDQQRQQFQATHNLQQWRAVLDAQHKRAMEIIGAYAQTNLMPPEMREQLLKDANEGYEKAIKEMGAAGKQSQAQGKTQVAAYTPGPRDTNIPPLNPADWDTSGRPLPGKPAPSPYDPAPRPRPPRTGYPEDFMS